MRYRLRKRTKRLIITAIGALLGLLTFVVKDAYRERVKNLTDLVEAGASTFLIVRQGEGIQRKLNNVRSQVRDLRAFQALEIGYITKMKTKDINNGDFYVPELEDGLALTQLSLDDTSRMIDELPGGKRFMNEYAGMLGEVNDYQRNMIQLQDLQKDIRTTDQNGKERSDPEKIVKATILSQRVYYQGGTVASDADTLSRKILAYADDLRLQGERKYVRLSWLSYVLFGASSVITAIGIIGTGGYDGLESD